MATTIRDIAKLAKVSASTVSRVINDDPRISEKTKKKVKKIIEEMNYIPNSMAKQLVMKTSFNIGFLFNSHINTLPVDYYFYNMIGGLQSVIFSNNYELTICDFSYLKPTENLLERFVYNKRVDGVVLHATLVNADIIKRLNDIDFPYVVIGNINLDFPSTWVDIDNNFAGELACKHMLDRGYKKIAFIGGTATETVSNQRIEGYKRQLTSSKIPVNSKYIMNGMGTDEDGYRCMKELLQLDPLPDAVICINDYTAFGVIKALKETNLKLPEEVGIITFDNFPLAPYMTPSLTSIDIDTFKLGIRAGEMIMEKVKGDKQHKEERISPGIIFRDSTAKDMNLILK